MDNITSYTFKPHIDGKLFAIQPSQKGVQVPAIFGSGTCSAGASIVDILTLVSQTRGCLVCPRPI